MLELNEQMQVDIKKQDALKPQPQSEPQMKTRVKKINPKMRTVDEETKHQIKLSKLSILEEDEDIQKEDKGDSDYEMEDENNPKTNTGVNLPRKRNKARQNKEIKKTYGKLNLMKYFIFEKESINNEIPNYNNIVVKATYKKTYKLCNICFNLSNYTCPRCNDKFCSAGCFKTHSEIKCIKYLDL